ncbi:PTS sugar transporter subunit IIA [Lacticaseibacillus daqingensis]|uniref:PTS sugar transporter subunit IIA n=1 Tax=Lacticaseibacillus daqingensis TaxID=2486014 RepID=UPI000F787A62|nr:PTS sugar transporter subunit IIA [Lacticaseibacillus daqingensis]
MFKLFSPKHVAVAVTLENANELSALSAIATVAAERLALSATALKASFIASVVQGDQLAAERVVVLHATSDGVTTPQSVLLSFAEPVLWGTPGTPIDFALAVVIPDAAPEDTWATLQAQTIARLEAHAADLTALKSNASALNRLNQSLLA